MSKTFLSDKSWKIEIRPGGGSRLAAVNRSLRGAKKGEKLARSDPREASIEKSP